MTAFLVSVAITTAVTTGLLWLGRHLIERRHHNRGEGGQ